MFNLANFGDFVKNFFLSSSHPAVIPDIPIPEGQLLIDDRESISSDHFWISAFLRYAQDGSRG